MASTKEAPVTAKIIREIRKLPFAHARKVHADMYGNVGEPDIDACIRGRAVKIECKAPGRIQKVTPRQVAAINAWRSAGAIAMVVTSWEEVEEQLKAANLIQ